MILSPKTRFLTTADAKALLELVSKDYFLNSLTIALAQMQMEMPAAKTPSEAWDCHSQMYGAKHFIEILLNLPEPPPLPKKPIKDNLNP